MARLIEKYVDDTFLEEIAKERTKGRILLIGATNLDTQRPVLWDMGRIAMSNNRDAIVLFQKILLALATLPGVFPPVQIQVRFGGKDYDERHVDGGITRQVFIAPSIFSFASGNPFDHLGNHPRHFGLAVCDLLRAVSVMISASIAQNTDGASRSYRLDAAHLETA